MNQKYSVISRMVDGRVEHSYKGKVDINSTGRFPIMKEVNSFRLPSSLEKITKAHKEILSEPLTKTKIKTIITESVNNKSKFRNWLSGVLEDIRVYTGPH